MLAVGNQIFQVGTDPQPALAQQIDAAALVALPVQTMQAMPLQQIQLHQLQMLQQPPFQQQLPHQPQLFQQQLQQQCAVLVHFQQVPLRQQAAPPPDCLSPQESDLLAAIKSLYADQLCPYGRILRKRLAEHNEAQDVEPRRLRAACEASRHLDVKAEEGGDWSALLRGRPNCFVNVYSPEDVYPPEVWQALDLYFNSLDDASMTLPGGRYSCAQVLVSRRLPFLAPFSLGQVCHIVQLAISQKKLLGYLSGSVVPYRRSQSMMKEHYAERQWSSVRAPKGAGLATWEMLRSFFQVALAGMSSTQSIPLSDIKRLFRSKYGLQLSETALGYPKLSEVLQDPRLNDLCALRIENHGYAVFRVKAAEQAVQRPCAQSASTGATASERCSALVVRQRPAALSLDQAVNAPGAGVADDEASGTPAPKGTGAFSTPESQCSIKGPLFPPTPEGATPKWQPSSADAAGGGQWLPTLLGTVRAPATAAGWPKDASVGTPKPCLQNAMKAAEIA